MAARDDNTCWTEHDLRSALASLEELAPDPVRVLAAVLAPAHRTSAGRISRRDGRGSWKSMPRMPFRRPPRSAVVLLSAAAGGMATVAAAVMIAGMPADGRSPVGNSAAALRHAVLTAFQATQGQILHSQTVDSLGGRIVARAQAWDWQGSAPRRWMRRQLLMTPGGLPLVELAEDAVPVRSCLACARNAVSTIVAVSYPARLWAEDDVRVRVAWGSEPLNSRIRQVVASGHVQVAGRMNLAGVRAIELKLTRDFNGFRDLLWVNARTYLPIRLVQVLTKPIFGLPAGLTVSTWFQFLPATRQNLVLLRAVMPSRPGWGRENLNSFFPDYRPLPLVRHHTSALEWITVFRLLVGHP